MDDAMVETRKYNSLYKNRIWRQLNKHIFGFRQDDKDDEKNVTKMWLTRIPSWRVDDENSN